LTFVPEPSAACPICAANTVAISSVRSDFSRRDFAFRRCLACGLSFIADPRLDFENVYDEAYYEGRGADSHVDYLEEMANDHTVRTYEWAGIERAVLALKGATHVRWLDLGCGLGGLVRHGRAHGFANLVGFDEGWAADWARRHDIPVLDRSELDQRHGTFDVITAIEVIEHVPQPVAFMCYVAELLAPGGVFFLTTGNAEPHRDQLTTWSYVHPDVHVCYYEPRTLAELYRRAGLEAVRAGFLPGFDDIIRYKVLKTLRRRSTSTFERSMPWAVVSRVVDRRHRVTNQPFARKPVATTAASTGAPSDSA
jgi:SAM-dependent methyltransferase